MRFYRESLLEGLRDQAVATTAAVKVRRYFESSDLALVFQELYVSYLRAEVNDDFDDKEYFLFPIDVNAELLCLSSTGLVKILSKFGSETHHLILGRKKTREGTWIKINWRKFRRIISKESSNTFEGIARKHKIRKQEEIEQAESSPDVDEIYILWKNTSANVAKPNKCNDDVRMAIAKALDKYGKDNIKTAIKNLEICTNHIDMRWYNIKWGLKNFLKQSNGIPNWFGDQWEASNMNPGNRVSSDDGLQVADSDFIHNDEDLETVHEAFEDACDYVEEHNERDINKTTFKTLIEFFNVWEEACGKLLDDVDSEKGEFNIDKFGKQAKSDGDEAYAACLSPPTILKTYIDYLNLKVLTKDRTKKNIPLNAGDFDWSRKHIEGFVDYFKRTGSQGIGAIHRVKYYLSEKSDE